MTGPEPHQKQLVIEYRQLVNRLGKLKAMLKRYREGTLDFTPKTPIGLLIDQANRMDEYLTVLEERAEVEGIDITVEQAINNRDNPFPDRIPE